jgi:hypothetical protein
LPSDRLSDKAIAASAAELKLTADQTGHPYVPFNLQKSWNSFGHNDGIGFTEQPNWIGQGDGDCLF